MKANSTLNTSPERSRRALNTLNRLRTINILRRILFYSVILIFTIAFTSPLTPPPSGWYQQFLPNLGGRQISDIFFLDSLTGWAVTPYLNVNDTTYVLKTTNGGDNWFIQHTRVGQFVGSNRIVFLNANTGYTAGVSWLPAYSAILKTMNGGNNWFNINPPTDPFTVKDISILNESTIWAISDNSLTGGVFRTTNGGANWDHQLNLGSDNPDHIYMYDGRLGFIAKLQVYLRRTTNGGSSWTVDTTGSLSGFLDMYFADSLTGWKASGDMRKTTNGGLNWFVQTLPQGGIIQLSRISSFSNINRDTIWGNGGYVLFPNNQVRGLVHRTTNAGTNWLFQIPDTSIHIGTYRFCDFVNRNNGWAYIGIHTITGGDTTFYTGIQQTPNAVPEGFVLKQNYPNPFNPRTVIPYSLSSPAHVKIIAYDITGREVQRMVDSYQQAGAYEVDFMGKFTASGVYFYRMTVDDKVVGTRKMILIK